MSIDRGKFQADDAKDKKFTKNKLDDWIRWLDVHTNEYLRILREMDEWEDGEETSGEFTREVVVAKLKEAKECLDKYESYQRRMQG